MRNYTILLIALAVGVVATTLTTGGLFDSPGGPRRTEASGNVFTSPKRPVAILFDTDMGNDIDDALALAVLHALESRGECRIVSVTSSKDNPHSAPFCDLVNTFYGRGAIPVGAVLGGKTPEESPYIREPSIAVDNGQPRYPHDITHASPAPDAVAVLRSVLAKLPEQSAVMVVVGFSTNFARLLDSPADDVSPLSGRDLVKSKCRFLSAMAGKYVDPPMKEYNVETDIPSARKVFETWPTPIIASGFEIGSAVKFPARGIQRDFNYIPHHPIREAYQLYMPMPYDRETWDLTSALFAVRPEHGYFGVRGPGRIRVDDTGMASFEEAADGKHYVLTLQTAQIDRLREALILLASQPPNAR